MVLATAAIEVVVVEVVSVTGASVVAVVSAITFDRMMIPTNP